MEHKKAFKSKSLKALCDPAGTRTQDPYIKSVLLYQLSYGIIAFISKAVAKVVIFPFETSFYQKKLFPFPQTSHSQIFQPLPSSPKLIHVQKKITRASLPWPIFAPN